MIILASDGISETKCCQHEADHCYQSFNRQHPLSPPFPDSLSGFYVNGGSQSFRGGLTAYHPGSPKEILPHFDRDFNRIHFGVGKVAGSIFNIVSTSRRYELGVSFVVLNYICLVFMQILAAFYFNYIIYSGLLIFCCQNVAASTKDFYSKLKSS